MGGEDAELVLVKGSRDDLLSLIDGLRRVFWGPRGELGHGEEDDEYRHRYATLSVPDLVRYL
jgi:hypothetical protein